MAEPRKRDRVWSYTFQKCLVQDAMTTPTEIADLAGVSERTAREALNIISGTPYIDRELAQDGTVRFIGSDLVHFKG